MISASINIASDPWRVYRFVADDANMAEHYRRKYDITFNKDYEAIPVIGSCTTFKGKVDNIFLTFESEVIKVDEPYFIARHIRFTDLKVDGITCEEIAPEVVLSDLITPIEEGVVLKTTMALASNYGFWKRMYYWYCYLREYGEFRRYVRYVKTALETE